MGTNSMLKSGIFILLADLGERAENGLQSDRVEDEHAQEVDFLVVNSEFAVEEGGGDDGEESDRDEHLEEEDAVLGDRVGLLQQG